MRYVAFIHSGEKAGFGISFPDFPGCISVGSTRADVVRLGAEALAFHVEGMIEDSQPIPRPRSIPDIRSDPNLTEWRDGAELEHVAAPRAVAGVYDFVAGLADTPGPHLFNPWFERDERHDASECSVDVRRRHLEHYLMARVGHAKHLLVAEAPGYQGAHFSGIAMTSERILLGHLERRGISPCHVLPGLKPDRTSSDRISGRSQAVRNRGFTEPTATVVWRTLLDLGVNPLEVVLWNAVPWHPYRENDLLSNRTPRQCEREASKAHLQAFLGLFPSARPVGVGQVSQGLLAEYGGACSVIHPARGRGTQFAKELKLAVRQDA